jgi:hypothetical protein
VLNPTDVDGHGTIAGPHGGQASFDLGVALQKTKKKTKLIGSVMYNDPATPFSISSSKITSLTFSGNSAHITGTAKLSKKNQLSFTVDVIDNGSPGTNDFFSIQVSNGYSASGNLTSGDISIH